MNRSRIARVLQLGFTLVLVAFVFTNAFSFLVGDTTFLGNYSETHSNFQPFRQLGIPPYSIRLASVVVAGLVIMLEPGLAARLLQMPIFRWAFAAMMFFTWGMIIRTFNAPVAYPDPDLLKPFWSQFSSLAFLLSCVVILDRRDVVYLAKRGIMLATVLGVVLNLYELLYPGTFSNVLGRAAGLYINSNGSGMALVLGGLIGLPTVPPKWREAFILGTLAGVLATISRTAVLSVFVLLVAAALGRALSPRRLLVGGALCITLFVAFNVESILEHGNISSDFSRLTSADESARDRMRLAQKSLGQFEAAPLLGQGFGTDEYWSDEAPHNLYLKLMADEGILGILVLPLLVVSVRRRSWDFYAFAIVFLLWCLFDHFIFFNPWAMMFVALEAVEASESRRVRFGPEAGPDQVWRLWPAVSRL